MVEKKILKKMDEKSRVYGGMDMSGAFITMSILVGVAILFFTEKIPIAATALLVPVCLSLFGILDPVVAFSYLGNKWCIIFLAMFMIGEAVFRTGFSTLIGEYTVNKAGKNPVKLMTFIMVVIGIMSAFLSNTGATAVFVPIVMGVAVSAGISPKKLLMPMAFASSLGGTLTLVGTPPNGVIASIIDETDSLTQFGFFEYGKVGIILFIISIAYMVIFGHKLLPKGEIKDGIDDIAITEISEISGKELRNDKMWIAVAVFVFVIIAMATGIIELQTAGILGAILCVVTGCITMDEAFESVNWTSIFVFAGLLPLSKAMSETGATKMIAEWATGLVSSPIGVLIVIYLITAVLTNFMSNMVATAMVAPIGLTIAQTLGFSPYPVLMATCMAASACFLTPIATPPNTIVLGPGGYKFMDYFKAGWPLQVISFGVCMIVIPILFPF
jgi:anion transporter